jgi:hypothetical protein
MTDYFIGALSNKLFMESFAAMICYSKDLMCKLEAVHKRFEAPVRTFRGQSPLLRRLLAAETSMMAQAPVIGSFMASAAAQAAVGEGQSMPKMNATTLRWSDTRLFHRMRDAGADARKAWLDYMVAHEQFVQAGIALTPDALMFGFKAKDKKRSTFINSALFIYGLSRRQVPFDTVPEDRRLYLYLGYFIAALSDHSRPHITYSEDHRNKHKKETLDRISDTFIPKDLRTEFVRVYNPGQSLTLEQISAEVVSSALKIAEGISPDGQDTRVVDECYINRAEHVRAFLGLDYKSENISVNFEKYYSHYRSHYGAIQCLFMGPWDLHPGLKLIVCYLLYGRQGSGTLLPCPIDTSSNINPIRDFYVFIPNKVRVSYNNFDAYLAEVLPGLYEPINVIRHKPYINGMALMTIFNRELIMAIKRLKEYIIAKVAARRVAPRAIHAAKYTEFLTALQAWAVEHKLEDIITK